MTADWLQEKVESAIEAAIATEAKQVLDGLAERVAQKVEKRIGDLAELMTVRQVAEVSPGITEGVLYRWIDESGDELERAGALIRMGRRVYLVAGPLMAWIRSRSGDTPPPAPTPRRRAPRPGGRTS